MDRDTFNTYEQFIRVVTGRIEEHFKDQNEYICCKEGCSHCCTSGEYPCSFLELDYLATGFSFLPEATQNIIYGNIKKIKEEKSNFTGKHFLYTCPFLIDNKCSIYNHRMLVCRTFGLIYYNNNTGINKANPMKVPFCVEKGLNYSKVYDKEKNNLSIEKAKKLGYKNDPVAYNLNFYDLREKVGKEMLNLDFGEEKSLIDWL